MLYSEYTKFSLFSWRTKKNYLLSCLLEKPQDIFFFSCWGKCQTFRFTHHLFPSPVPFEETSGWVFSILRERCLDIFHLFSFPSYSWDFFFFLLLDKTVVSVSSTSAWTTLIAFTLKKVSLYPLAGENIRHYLYSMEVKILDITLSS